MDDLELVEFLGDGGQGRVYCVRKASTGVEYALKVMQCREQTQLDYALKEVKVLTQLRHENIVSYIDFFLRLDGGPHFTLLGKPQAAAAAAAQPAVSVILVMEMCRGGTLADRIKAATTDFMSSGEHNVSERCIVRWLRQCALALRYMHDRGFLHRDLKPANVFLHGDTAKLGDFGLATPNISGRGATSHVGTPYYLAPELLLRRPYDEKVDVWGLGLTFLELTTLRERPINTEILENLSCVDGVIHDIEYMGFSKNLATLIRDMLQRQPSQRPTPLMILERTHVDDVPFERVSLTPPSLDEPHPSPSGETKPTAPIKVPAPPEPKQPVSLPTSPCIQHIPDAQIPNPNDAPLRASDFAPVQQAADVPHGMCDMCQVYPAVVVCSACDGERYCHGCDEVKHRNTRRASHSRCAVPPDSSERVVALAPKPPCNARARSDSRDPPPSSIDAAPSRPRHTAAASAAAWCGEGTLDPVARQTPEGTATGSAPPSRGTSPLEAPVFPQPALRRSSLFVPSQKYRSIIEALADAHAGTTIVVAGNCTFADPIVLRVPGVTLLGEGTGDDRPRIGDGHLVSLTVAAPECRVVNFAILQSLPGAEPSDRPFGVYVSCNGSATIEKCDIVSAAGNGIGVAGPSTEATIRDCTLRDAKQAGLYVFGGAKCVVTGTTIARCEHAGVLLKKRARAQISGCTIRDGLQSGVFCNESSGVFERNLILNNGGCGVVLKTKADPIVRFNEIRSSGQTGVFCCDRSTGTITGNTIVSSGKAGVIIKTGAHPTITKNKIVQGKEVGIYAFESGQGHVEDNDIGGNGTFGIVVTSGADPRVVRNRIHHNQLEGVFLCGGRGYFESNDLRSNIRGAKDISQAAEGLRWQSNRESAER